MGQQREKRLGKSKGKVCDEEWVERWEKLENLQAKRAKQKRYRNETEGDWADAQGLWNHYEGYEWNDKCTTTNSFEDRWFVRDAICDFSFFFVKYTLRAED